MLGWIRFGQVSLVTWYSCWLNVGGSSLTSLIVIVTSAVDLVDSSRPDCETNECEISSTTVAWHAHCTPGSFPLVGSLARTSYFAGCRRGLLCSPTCATVQLCNERFLAQPFSHHCATLEGPSAPKWGGQPMQFRQCSSGRMGRVLTLQACLIFA